MRLRAILLSCLALPSICLAQDYVEKWRVFTSGSGLEKVFWGPVAVDPSDNVLVSGIVIDVFPDSQRQVIASKYTSGGDEVWTTRSDIGPTISARDTNVDGAGNLYMVGTDSTLGTIKVKSLNGTDGSPRWERSFANRSQVSGRNGADLAVRTVGNSTFIYFASSEANNSIRLTRLVAATGEIQFVTFVPGSLASPSPKNLEIDGNGNVYMLFQNGDATIAKRNQGLNLVWSRTQGNDFDAGFGIHPTTGEVAFMTAPSSFTGPVTMEVLDPVNGSVRRQKSDLGRSTNGFSAVQAFGHPTGAWYYTSSDAFGTGGQQILSPTLNIEFSRTLPFEAVFADSSGMLHGDIFNANPRLMNWPRLSQLDLGLGQGGTGSLAFDSADRVISAGSVGGVGVILQHEQKFLAGTDTFAEPFISELDVEAPGVLANDLLSRSGVLSVVTTTTKGTLTLRPDGGFRYVPGATFDGVDQFQYRLTKGTVSRTATCFVRRLTIASLTLSRNSVIGGETGVAVNVTLSTGTFNVPLNLNVFASPPGILSNFPGNYFFRTGQVSEESTASTKAVSTSQNVTFTATLAGQTKSVTLTLLPGEFIGIDPLDNQPLFEGLKTRLRLKLQDPPLTARRFGLEYRGTSVLTGPTEVTVPAGQTFVDFDVTAPDGTAGDQTEILVQTDNNTFRFLIQETIVARPHISSTQPLTPPIYAGFPHRFQVVLDRAAGNTSIPVTNSTNNTGVTVPTVNIAPGRTDATAAFTPALTVANQTVTVTSRLLTDTKTSTFLVRPNLLETFTVSPGIMSPFGSVTGRVTFNWVATGDGIPVRISTSTPTLVLIPSEVTMLPGRTVLTFPIAARGRGGNAKVTVKVGQKTITKGITITN